MFALSKSVFKICLIKIGYKINLKKIFNIDDYLSFLKI